MSDSIVAGYYRGGKRTEAVREISGRCFDVVTDVYGRSLSWTSGSRSLWTNRSAAFLIGRGWSATRERWTMILDAGVPTMAVNDCPRGIRPRTWCSGDPPGYFHRRIWLDPEIIKFLPVEYAGMYIPRISAYGPRNQITARDCPNVYYFFKSCNDDPADFLSTPWINWGTMSIGPNDVKGGGTRSSMLIGLRLLYHLGFRTVFLLGSDFEPQGHGRNPNYYQWLQEILEPLREVFEHYGYWVVNANVDSHLRVFPFMTFDKALSAAAAA